MLPLPPTPWLKCPLLIIDDPSAIITITSPEGESRSYGCTAESDDEIGAAVWFRTWMLTERMEQARATMKRRDGSTLELTIEKT